MHLFIILKAKIFSGSTTYQNYFYLKLLICKVPFHPLWMNILRPNISKLRLNLVAFHSGFRRSCRILILSSLICWCCSRCLFLCFHSFRSTMICLSLHHRNEFLLIYLSFSIYWKICHLKVWRWSFLLLKFSSHFHLFDMEYLYTSQKFADVLWIW